VLPTFLFLLALATSFSERASAAVTRPLPGTVKAYITKLQTPGSTSGIAMPVDSNLLAAAGASVVDEEQNYLVISLPGASVSSLQRGLTGQVQGFEVRNDFDILDFRAGPVDVRAPQTMPPAPWFRADPLPSPARDAFIIQFAAPPKQEWFDVLRVSGVTILDYMPQNAYLVLATASAVSDLQKSLPIQYAFLHQPFNKVQNDVRAATSDILELVIQLADTSEGDDVEAVLTTESIGEPGGAELVGNHRLFRVSLPTSAIADLAAMPGLIAVEVEAPLRPSGEREAHLIAGGTMAVNTGSPAVWLPAAGDYRTWLTSVGLSNYKTAAKVAIIDTGFDSQSPPSAFKDFLSDSGVSFVTPVNYLSAYTSNSGDCFGHGTMVAGVLVGNAGGPFSTTTRDIGSQYGNIDFRMGLGVAPGVPLVVGKVVNYDSIPGNPTVPRAYQLAWSTIFADLSSRGVNITSSSVNQYRFQIFTAGHVSFDYTTYNQYDSFAMAFDQQVRHTGTTDAGPPMSIICAAGNINPTDPLQDTPNVVTPSTAKNVISVGGAESYNPIPSPSIYPEPNLSPVANSGLYADNGNDIWTYSCHGTRSSDGRFKPDVVAPATAVESAKTRDVTACLATNASVGAVIDAASPPDQQHLWSRGTSFAAPAAAGAAELLYTWYKNRHSGSAPSPAMLKAMMINLSTDVYPGGRSPSPAVLHSPDQYQGWGRVDLSRAFQTGDYIWDDQSAGRILTPSAQSTWFPTSTTSYTIKDTSKPVRITVVWTDHFGSTTSGNPLVNDLDISVINPVTTYFCTGNNINRAAGSNGDSLVYTTLLGGPGFHDHANNLEEVIFRSSDLGGSTFQVSVSGKTIAMDGINPVANTTLRQDFALFIENVIGQ
jgi:hypothetical protein